MVWVRSAAGWPAAKLMTMGNGGKKDLAKNLEEPRAAFGVKMVGRPFWV
jgi:hypothetical protein